MSEEASEGPMVTFCTRKCTEGPMLYSLITNLQRGLVPRTHLANVIIRNNISEKRMLELKLKQINRMKIKTFYFNENLKKKFVSKLQKKSTRWEKEHERFIKYLHLDEKRKSTNSILFPSGSQQLPELEKSC